jgi:hypothetical protein
MSKMWQRRIMTQVLMEGAISSNIEREPDEMPDVRPDTLPAIADAFVFQKFSEER